MTKVSVYLGRREILLGIGKPEDNSNLSRFCWLRGLDWTSDLWAMSPITALSALLSPFKGNRQMARISCGSVPANVAIHRLNASGGWNRLTA
jgi:hypothetical protein